MYNTWKLMEEPCLGKVTKQLVAKCILLDVVTPPLTVTMWCPPSDSTGFLNTAPHALISQQRTNKALFNCTCAIQLSSDYITMT